MTMRLSLLLALALAVPAHAAAQPTVFLVRHAERADTMAPAPPAMPSAPGTMSPADPDLSPAGRTRAASLAAELKDAGITAIYATELKRTQQTAAPVAQALGLTVITIPAADVTTLLAKLKAGSGNALVVGHSNTVPALIKGLGVKVPVTVDESEFDNLFIVVRAKKPAFLRLHYR